MDRSWIDYNNFLETLFALDLIDKRFLRDNERSEEHSMLCECCYHNWDEDSGEEYE